MTPFHQLTWTCSRLSYQYVYLKIRGPKINFLGELDDLMIWVVFVETHPTKINEAPTVFAPEFCWHLPQKLHLSKVAGSKVDTVKQHLGFARIQQQQESGRDVFVSGPGPDVLSIVFRVDSLRGGKFEMFECVTCYFCLFCILFFV